MSEILVGVYIFFWGFISGVAFGAYDKKHNAQSLLAMLFLPGLGLALLFLVISLIWEIAPTVSLDATSKGIVEFFAHD